MKRNRPGVGDIFTIPLADGDVAVGQVVARYLAAYYLAVFGTRVSGGGEFDLDWISKQDLAFVVLTLDAKFVNGDWCVVGSGPVASVPLPAYKEMVRPGEWDVVDYSGELRRPATAGEARALPNRTVVAPVRLEKAIRARHGLEPWLDHYAELEPPVALTTAKLFPAH